MYTTSRYYAKSEMKILKNCLTPFASFLPSTVFLKPVDDLTFVAKAYFPSHLVTSYVYERESHKMIENIH